MRSVLAALALLALAAAPRLGAQVRPDLDWRTLRTPRFRVHFTADVEPLAQRTLANAERAYRQLAERLPTPRGVIDIVVADNLDLANGSATPFPSNRIIVYARPPVDEPLLRVHEDWNRTLVTHELAHIFQLDRVAGLWALGQRVFGRAAPLFPHTYAPRWLLEGVAIHYESALTRGGRLESAEREAQLDALAAAYALPPLDALALPFPFYPLGNAAYLVGAAAVQAVLTADPRVPADTAMARLFTRMSRRVLPWRIDASAREATGRSFTAAYGAWAAARTETEIWRFGATTPAVVPETVLTTHEFVAAYPRFTADGAHITYVAEDGRRVPGVYELRERVGPTAGPRAAPASDTGGGHLALRRRRIARRNDVAPYVPYAGVLGVHTEWEFVDPYTLRSDLYFDHGWLRRRVTHAARLAHVDARAGAFVALRTRAGTTDLVRVWPSEPDNVTVIAAGSLDRYWAEPRLSHDGRRVAAVEWSSGGRVRLVVLDLEGRELASLAPRATDDTTRLALVSGPAWVPGDSALVFVSDHEGRPALYVADLVRERFAPLWYGWHALRSPDVSPDGRELVAVSLDASGWQVVRRPMPTEVAGAWVEFATAADGAGDDHAAEAGATQAVGDAREGDAARTSGEAVAYRAWTTALPRWWLPAAGQSDEGATLLGATTGGRDVIGRHTWTATLLQDLTRDERSGSLGYSWAGLGNPVLSLGFVQDWAHARVLDAGDVEVGRVGIRSSTISGTVRALRPRIRVSSFALVGAEAERVSYALYPGSLGASDPTLAALRPRTFMRAVAAVGFNTLQRPLNAVSAQDGVALQLTARARPEGGVGDRDVHEGIGELVLARGIPLPGFSQHVLAWRGAVGATQVSTRDPFTVGGVSGGLVELLPGLAVGDPVRTFFVRGAPPGAQRGNRAAVWSAEYRAPLARVARGVGLLPVFFQKASLAAFTDHGAAWCEGRALGAGACGGGSAAPQWLRSVGAELVVDAALNYDVLYRFRLGLAAPLASSAATARGTSLYFTVGNSF